MLSTPAFIIGAILGVILVVVAFVILPLID
ncbi:hypothetical protein [Proteus phage RP7]|nr:hypothetical protein [Proteus phage RP7]